MSKGRHLVRKCVEQTRRETWSNVPQPRLPISEGDVERVSKLLEFAEATLQSVQLRLSHRVNLAAGSAATPFFGEHK